MASLPTPGGDTDTWGNELNTYLLVEHDSAGYHDSFANDIQFDGDVGIGIAPSSFFKFQLYSTAAGQLDALVTHGGNGTTDMARIGCRDYGASSTMIEHYVNAYVGTGCRQAGCGAIYTSGSNGLNLCAQNSSGYIRFYTGGDTSGQLHAYFNNAGSMAFINSRQLLWEDSGGTARATLQVYSDDNTYLDGYDELVFRSNAAANVCRVDNTGAFEADLTGRWHLGYAAAGSSSAPTYSFKGDEDLGMFRSGANILSFSVGSATKVNMAATGVQMLFATDNLEFQDSGLTGGTDDGWIELDMGGSTRYIRVNSTK